MPWVLLILAGVLEVCWAIGLKYTNGFTALVPSILVVATFAASLVLLSLAVRTLPISTAYAIFVGIGALGAAVLGSILFKEPMTLARMFFLAMLLISIIGLKLTTGSGSESV